MRQTTGYRAWIGWLVALGLASSAGTMRAAPQEPAGTTPPPPQSSPTASSATGGAPPIPPVGWVDAQVVAARGMDRDGAKVAGDLTLDDLLTVEVTGLETWLRNSQRSGCDVHLFLNGRPLRALQPVNCDVRGEELTFDLWQIDRGKEDAWQYLLRGRDGFDAKATVSVGFVDAGPLPTALTGERSLTFLVVHKLWALITLLLFALTLLLFVWLVRVSTILRDGPPGQETASKPPYSLARFQMAWWFFLILGGYLMLSLLTGALVAIPGTILSLMAIASGTFLGAEVIGASKQDDGTLAKPTPSTSGLRGFFADILSDSNGIAFHRFQIFIWTVALGLIYTVRVWNNLAMPQFDTNLLGLMGLSSGTYLGFKFPEQTKPEQTKPE